MPTLYDLPAEIVDYILDWLALSYAQAKEWRPTQIGHLNKLGPELLQPWKCLMCCEGSICRHTSNRFDTYVIPFSKTPAVFDVMNVSKSFRSDLVRAWLRQYHVRWTTCRIDNHTRRWFNEQRSDMLSLIRHLHIECPKRPGFLANHIQILEGCTSLRSLDIEFSIWDLARERQYAMSAETFLALHNFWVIMMRPQLTQLTFHLMPATGKWREITGIQIALANIRRLVEEAFRDRGWDTVVRFAANEVLG